MPSGRLPVEGSDREPVPGAKKVGPVPTDQEVRVTIVVRRRGGAELPAVEGAAPALSREEFARKYGADPADLERVQKFAVDHGLEVRESDPARRSVVLAGPAETVARAFAVELDEYETEGVRYRGRTGPVRVPAEIAPIVTAVMGLDSRPQAKPHFRRLETEGLAARTAQGFTPREIAGLYDFPTDLDGSGQKIALIELGGGYRDDDLKTYFESIGVPTPTVTAVSVSGALNNPTTANSADGEVVLDIEVAGAVAPGAEILVYFARNTDRGFHEAITTAVHDPRAPSVVSISWGAPEDSQFWTEQSRRTYDEAFQEAAIMGVTVFVAAGDNGSSDGVNDGNAHVDFPAASPHVVACGGTRLIASNGTIAEERVWETNGATGGGVSGAFELPAWQQDTRVESANPPHGTGRCVPDVSGDADPETGYRVRVDGDEMVIGGTSAVAPLWAGLIALANQKLERPVGYLNPTLYSSETLRSTFRDITDGSNGAYAATAGWDACTGFGSPAGKDLLTALAS